MRLEKWVRRSIAAGLCVCVSGMFCAQGMQTAAQELQDTAEGQTVSEAHQNERAKQVLTDAAQNEAEGEPYSKEYGKGIIDLGDEVQRTMGGGNARSLMRAREADVTQHTDAVQYPEKFDPRELENSYLNSTKNQYRTGLCWAFGLLASAEMEAIKNQGADKDFELSVWQLASGLYRPITDPLGLTEGDGTAMREQWTDIYNIGGILSFGMMAMAHGISPIPNSEAPFETLYETWQTKPFDQKTVLPNDKYYGNYRLKDSVLVYPNDREGMKKAILQYGAGVTQIYADAIGNTRWWSPTKPCALYVDMYYGITHAVSIVGWDDNFPKEGFGSQIPPGDGAWLCRNSWGSEREENGYFWLSYYDIPFSTCRDYTVFNSITEVEEGEHLYQYDGGCSYATYFGGRYDADKYANVFDAQKEEDLTSVSFFTLDPDITYTIEIYQNGAIRQDGDPTGGEEPVAVVNGFQPDRGYHVVDLPVPVSLSVGDKFSVVLRHGTYVNGSYQHRNALADTPYSMSSLPYTVVTKSKPGQSYVFDVTGTWNDISAEGDKNLRIKAFTKER